MPSITIDPAAAADIEKFEVQLERYAADLRETFKRERIQAQERVHAGLVGHHLALGGAHARLDGGALHAQIVIVEQGEEPAALDGEAHPVRASIRRRSGGAPASLRPAMTYAAATSNRFRSDRTSGHTLIRTVPALRGAGWYETPIAFSQCS